MSYLIFRPLGEEPVFVSQALIDRLANEQRQVLSAAVQDIAGKMGEEMQKEIIKATALQLGVTLALTAIPVVGIAASAIAGLVASIAGAQYQNSAKKILATTESDIAKMQADSDVRINNMLVAAFALEKKAAIELAMSGQALDGLNGLGGWFSKVTGAISKAASDVVSEAGRFTSNIAHEADRVSSTVAQELERIGVQVREEAIDPITGKAIETKAKETREKLIKEAGIQLAAHEERVRLLMTSPAFRETLRIDLARRLREDPIVQGMINQIAQNIQQAQQIQATVPAQGSSPGVPGPGSGAAPAQSSSLVVPALAVGGIVLASFFLLRD